MEVGASVPLWINTSGEDKGAQEVFPLPSPDESTLSGKFASGRNWNVHMVYALDGEDFY